GRHIHAHAAATDQNAPLGTARNQRAPHRFGKVRVIRRLCIVSAKVNHLMPQALQISANFLLQSEPRVVCSDDQPHRALPVSSGCDFRARSTSALARLATLSAPKPSSSRTFFPGAEAPKRSSPITSPCRPTYFHHPNAAPASTASFGKWSGKIEALYASLCSSKSFQLGIETTRTAMLSFFNCSAACSAGQSSAPVPTISTSGESPPCSTM